MRTIGRLLAPLLAIAFFPAPRALAGGAGLEVVPVQRVGERDGAPVYRKAMLSPVYTVDRIYKSMRGPMSKVRFRLWPVVEPQLLWVVGYRASTTGADGDAASPEFMCHSNVGVIGGQYESHFPSQLSVTGRRLFALDQGTHQIEFPSGFGIPVMSDHKLLFNPQVLNLNVVGKTLELRQKAEIDFIRDRDLARPLTPLVQHGVFGMVLLDGPDGHFGVAAGEGDVAVHGEGCSIAADAAGGGSGHIVSDGRGREFSAFWVVKPGRNVYHTRVTQQLDLPFDTTVHFISVHLHPFAESLELRDLTAGETVFRARAVQAAQGIGLDRVESYSSVEGIPIYRDHEYDLISTYDNTTDVDQEAMATMLLYLRAADMAPRLSSFR